MQSLLSVRCRGEVDRLFSWPLLDLFDCCKSCNTHLAWWGGSLSGAPPTQGASRRSASRPVAPPRASTPPELLPRFGWLARRLFFSLSWDCFRRSRVLCGSEQWKSREGVGRGRWAAGVRGLDLQSTTSRSGRESSTAIDRCASRDGDGSRGDGSRRGGRKTDTPGHGRCYAASAFATMSACCHSKAFFSPVPGSGHPVGPRSGVTSTPRIEPER